MTEEHELVDLGRLFRLRMRRSLAAREEALSSVRPRPDGRWQARIGGRIRGETRAFVSRAEAERAVHDHYNEAMLAWVRDATRKPAGV